MNGAHETRIAEIWSDSLGVPVTSSDHDFFADGDSFQAAVATAKVRREWGLDVTVQLMIDHPALGDYAKQVTALVSP